MSTAVASPTTAKAAGSRRSSSPPAVSVRSAVAPNLAQLPTHPANQAAVTARNSVQVQTSLRLSSPNDPAEKEAAATARKIMRMPVPESSVSYVSTGMGGVFREVKKEDSDNRVKLPAPTVRPSAAPTILTMQEERKIQRQAEGQSPVSSNVAANIQNNIAVGSPLPMTVRRFMEPRFGADFSGVRIHTGNESANLNRQLNAQAFAVSNHIFFGKDKLNPESHEGKELIAHELTHTIQQGAAVQRSEEVSVTQQSPTQVQRLGISDALNYFADKANLIPGFRMFTIILGVNPINMSAVDRSAANILRALVGFIPGGELIIQALDNYGVFDKVGNWVEQQIRTLGMTGAAIKQAVTQFLDSLGWSDIFNLGGVWERAKRIFTEPIDRIINFAKGLVSGVIQFIKDAILMPLAKLAQGTRGWDLLIAVLGKNPITGEAVPRTAETLIPGFLKLIGQEEVWENMKKANALGRAWAWFQGAMNALMGFVSQIPTLAVNAFKSLELMDIVLLPRAFAKVAAVFGNFIGNFIDWAGTAVWNLLEIIFAVVAPGVMPYIAKAKAAFRTILKDPIAFVGNLVRAGKLGFEMFASNILEHLKAALIKWITGPLGDAGVYIPKSFSLMEIIKLVLSVLGLTWQNIRSKLVKIIPEPVLVGLEKTAGILVTLIKDGPAAAWEQIKAELSELKDQLIAQVTQMITTEVVKAAVVKLLSMLNPAGAVVQAIIAIYNTVTFFIEKINQIAAVVASFIDSISAIASGQVANAAKKVEQTMANTLTVIIAFLAKFAGAGNIPNKLVGIIKKIRQPIDKGLDKIVGWLGNMLKKAGKFLTGATQFAADMLFEWWKSTATFSDKKGRSHRLFFSGEGESARLKAASAEMFTEDFVGKVQKAFADDALAKDFGLPYLGRCQQKKLEIDRLKAQLEREKKMQAPSAKFTDQKLKTAMNELAANMGPLFDVLPENKLEDLPVKPGAFVTLPYKGTERKAEILFASTERVHYEVQSLSSKMQLATPEFKNKWKAGEIRPYIEGGSREQYLGDTPGKASATGKAVIARYKTDVNDKKQVIVEWQPGKWWPLADCDMSHEPIDAVDYWNNTGRKCGPKAPEVRAWMLNENNYVLEPAHINRSRGSRYKQNYLPP
jgi:hypothetical protein